LHRRKRPGWLSRRRDETSITVKGQGRSLERAVEKQGQTLAWLLTEPRDTAAALRFLQKARRRQGLPETRPLDGSEAKEAASKSYYEEHGPPSLLRPGKAVNNLVEQDQRAVKRLTRPRLGFKLLAAAPCTVAGVALMPRSKTRQLVVEEGEEGLTTAERFSSLAA
jgi:putative transposase